MKTQIHTLKINFEIPVSPELKLSRFVYLYIIEGKFLHLVDSGVSHAISDIQHYIHKIGRKLSEVKTIMLTHSHPDHIGSAKLIQEKSGCEIYAPLEEAEWIENTQLQYKQRPIPGFHDLVSGNIKVDHKISDKDSICLEENISLQAISTPGHSAGSTAYYIQEEKILFSGDAILLPGEIPIFENIQQYFHSLEKIKKIMPETLYSAWDQPRTKNEIPEIIRQSETYIQNIQRSVKTVATQFREYNSIEFCTTVLKEVNLNERMANPLLLKSFLACLFD